MPICPRCHTPYYMNAIFCDTCGAPLRSLPEQAAPATAGTGPRSGPLRALVFIIQTSGRKVELRLGDEPLLIGRADASQNYAPALDLTDDGALDAGVSRRHARLLLRDNRIFVEDLGSPNGTWVNDARLQPNQPFPVGHGDTLRLGRLAVRVRLLAGETDANLNRG